jgi:dTDP-4-amino-4,6-dideoxygalactose transaminase
MGLGDRLVGDVEERLVTQVVRRQALFRMTGPASQAWRAEMELAEAYPGTRCLLLPSATTALALLLETLDLEAGSEVLITPFGWLANWSCIHRAGLRIGFLPLDRDLQLPVEAVAARITDSTRAVIVTHLMGRGQQAVGEIAELCADRGIPLLEDVAQSFGVRVRGVRAGTFGLGAWCSLNHHKVLSTGDGGFAMISDEALFTRVMARHDQGCILDNGKRRPHPTLEPGLSLRVNELTAAVLRAQLARYPWLRARIGRLYEGVAAACRSEGMQILQPNEGDLPFTVLVRHDQGLEGYPSLLDSGWHVAPQVNWLEEEFLRAADEDPALTDTLTHLGAVSAIGAGFTDPYYAIPHGLPITASPSEADAMVRELVGR